MSRSRIRIVGSAATLSVAGGQIGSFGLGAGSASATGVHPSCSIFNVGPVDDGPLSDPIHHSVEPLLPAAFEVPFIGRAHQTNCYIQGITDGISCQVPVLAPLRGSHPC